MKPIFLRIILFSVSSTSWSLILYKHSENKIYLRDIRSDRKSENKSFPFSRFYSFFQVSFLSLCFVPISRFQSVLQVSFLSRFYSFSKFHSFLQVSFLSPGFRTYYRFHPFLQFSFLSPGFSSFLQALVPFFRFKFLFSGFSSYSRSFYNLNVTKCIML